MNTNPPNPVTRAFRRYLLEFTIAMIAYVITMIASRWLLRGPLQNAAQGLQLAIALLPIFPVILVFVAVVRLLLHTDEFQRRIYIESLALAGGTTALLAVTYGLLESDRIPHLSAWWTYSTFMIAWLIATFFVRRKYQ